MKKNLLYLLFALLVVMNLSAQDIMYVYDNAGNRVERWIIPEEDSESEESSTSETEEAYLRAALRSSANDLLLTSLDNIANQEIKIYPNPTDGELMVVISNYSAEMQTEIWITDTLGRLINRKKANSVYTAFDLSKQARGVYLLNLKINGQRITKKIIKK